MHEGHRDSIISQRKKKVKKQNQTHSHSHGDEHNHTHTDDHDHSCEKTAHNGHSHSNHSHTHHDHSHDHTHDHSDPHGHTHDHEDSAYEEHDNDIHVHRRDHEHESFEDRAFAHIHDHGHNFYHAHHHTHHPEHTGITHKIFRDPVRDWFGAGLIGLLIMVGYFKVLPRYLSDGMLICAAVIGIFPILKNALFDCIARRTISFELMVGILLLGGLITGRFLEVALIALFLLIGSFMRLNFSWKD